MKKHYQSLMVLALSLSLIFSSSYIVRAHGDSEDDDERGGEVVGSESLEQTVRLTPTAAAPVGVSGKAEVEVENEDGVVEAELELKLEGLPIGTYSVAVTSLADGVTVTELGSFSVSGTFVGDSDDDDGDDDSEDGDDDSDDDDDEVEVKFGDEEGLPFPTGFNPMDIGVVSVSAVTTGTSGTTSAVILQGDFATARNSNFTAVVNVVPATDTDAGGMARVRSKVKHNRVLKSHFALTATNLPAKTPVIVKFNGDRTLNARTNAKGVLRLRKAPKGLAPSDIVTVEIQSLTGETLATVNF